MNIDLYYLIDSDDSLSDSEKREIYFENLEVIEDLKRLEQL